MRVFHQADCLESQDNHDNDDSPDRMSEKRLVIRGNKTVIPRSSDVVCSNYTRHV